MMENHGDYRADRLASILSGASPAEDKAGEASLSRLQQEQEQPSSSLAAKKRKVHFAFGGEQTVMPMEMQMSHRPSMKRVTVVDDRARPATGDQDYLEAHKRFRDAGVVDTVILYDAVSDEEEPGFNSGPSGLRRPGTGQQSFFTRFLCCCVD